VGYPSDSLVSYQFIDYSGFTFGLDRMIVILVVYAEATAFWSPPSRYRALQVFIFSPQSRLNVAIGLLHNEFDRYTLVKMQYCVLCDI